MIILGFNYTMLVFNDMIMLVFNYIMSVFNNMTTLMFNGYKTLLHLRLLLITIDIQDYALFLNATVILIL